MTRLADRIDDLYREFLDRAEYRDHVSAARPSVTGYVSSCHRAETRPTRNGDGWICVECSRECSTSSWHSPMSGQANRGGWDPSKRPDQQVMYVNPTHVRRNSGWETRLASGADRIGSLSRLFESIPRSQTKTEWKRALVAWRRKLVVGDYAETARRAVEDSGENPDEWTPDAIRAWVYTARAKVIERVTRYPSRYPGARL